MHGYIVRLLPQSSLQMGKCKERGTDFFDFLPPRSKQTTPPQVSKETWGFVIFELGKPTVLRSCARHIYSFAQTVDVVEG